MYLNLFNFSGSEIKLEKLHRLVVIIGCIFVGLTRAGAQELKIEGRFLSDSIKIGAEVPYVLTAKYPSDMVLLFPDSTFDFSPFELVSKTFAPTVSDSTMSYDSVVYYLTTFEIDNVQTLDMEVYKIDGYDSITLSSGVDSIFLKSYVKEIGPETELKADTVYEEVKLQFNTILWLIIAGVFVVIAIIVALVFGSQITRQIQIYWLKKRHQKFAKAFFERMNQLAEHGDTKQVEHLLTEWKHYLEKLQKVPYSTLTTKEILKLHSEEDIKEVLRNIDRSLYANQPLNVPFEQFDVLLKFSAKQFEKKIESIRNDK